MYVNNLNKKGKTGCGCLTIIVFFIMIAVIGGITITAVTAKIANSKEPITNEQFTTVMQEHGFEVGALNDVYDDEALLAVKDGAEGRFTFYEYDSDFDCQKNFDKHKEKVEETYPDGGLRSSSDFDSTATFSLTKDGHYYYFSKIDTTLLIVSASTDYKDKAIDIINELKY